MAARRARDDRWWSREASRPASRCSHPEKENAILAMGARPWVVIFPPLSQLLVSGGVADAIMTGTRVRCCKWRSPNHHLPPLRTLLPLTSSAASGDPDFGGARPGVSVGR
uniref:Uncharacterized protein n=1 Tax=Bionectria ochroleuca TaxID=29856 RepID=A0A8H7NIR4_BIOOC